MDTKGARPVAKPNAPDEPHRLARIVAEWAFAVVAALLWVAAFAIVGTMERMPDPVGALWEALGDVWHALTWGWA